MQSKRRQIVSPRKRPRADLEPSENRRRAQYGDLIGSRGAELYDRLTQLATAKPSRELCQLFVQELVELHEKGNGDPLRELAQLVERPIAHKAEEIAFQLESYYRQLATSAKDAKTPKGRKKLLPVLPGHRKSDDPMKRAVVIAIIRERAQCSERTAASAVDNTDLSELLGWQAGRTRR